VTTTEDRQCDREVTYSGAYCEPSYYGTTIWRLRNDDADLLKRADDDDTSVIWVSTPDELYQQLEERYPGRCRSRSTSCDVYPYPVVDDDGLDSCDERYDQEFAARIVAAAKTHGTVSVISPYRSLPRAIYDHVVIAGDDRTADNLAVTYDPVKAQKLKARRTKKAKQGCVPVALFYDACRQVRYALSGKLDITDIHGNLGRYGYIVKLQELLWLCEKLCGRRSYRRITAWQKFVTDWRRGGKQTVKTLTTLKSGESVPADTVDYITEFNNFMIKECRCKLPPAIEPYELRQYAKCLTWPR
jgi:hypothetical protein